MRALLLALLALLAAVLLLAGRAEGDDPARQARRQAEAELYALRVAQAERMADIDHLLGVAWRLLSLGVAVGAVGLAGRWAWLALDRYERERMPRRGDGLLPVRVEALDAEAAAALEGHRAAALAAAQRPPAPGVYSPQIHIAAGDGLAALPDPDRAEVQALLARRDARPDGR